MITTYQALELAASSLIDAVEDTDMSDDPGEWRRLLDAVADTCDALGHASAAHKARHRLAHGAEDQSELWADTGGDPDEAHADAREVIRGLADDLRGLVLAWDAPAICELSDLRGCLETLRERLEDDVTPGCDYGSDTFEPDISGGDIDAAAAQVSRALDAIDGVESTLAQLETGRDEAIAKLDYRSTGAGAMDAMADEIVSAHESGGPVLHVLGVVAEALRAAGREDAAALLVGGEAGPVGGAS